MENYSFCKSTRWGRRLYKCPLIVYNIVWKLLRVSIAHKGQIIQRSGGLGVQVVELPPKLVEIGEEIGRVVERHLARRRGIEQREILSGATEALHGHIHVTTETLIHVW